LLDNPKIIERLGLLSQPLFLALGKLSFFLSFPYHCEAGK